jgi:UDP-N-acetyl-D-glucosamine dehydrogenase
MKVVDEGRFVDRARERLLWCRAYVSDVRPPPARRPKPSSVVSKAHGSPRRHRARVRRTPLAVEFAKAGFRVAGIDIDARRVAQLKQGRSYIQDVPSAEVRELVRSGHLLPTTDFSVLRRVDAVNVCVPTPLSKQRDPDVSYIVSASNEVARHLHRGMLVILESTTYPGTTDELILPLLQATGMKVGRDFFLAFSPERRVDPGNPRFNTRNIPKVVGGVTPACTEVAAHLYRQRLEHVVPVSSTQVAEMVKLLENTFRSVNIGLVNEMALMCARLKIDVWEVIDAAATKPFGFMRFYPGPGLGGHCIAIDPFYLSWKARASGFEAVHRARGPRQRPCRSTRSISSQSLNRTGKAVRGARVLVGWRTRRISTTRERVRRSTSCRRSMIAARSSSTAIRTCLLWRSSDGSSRVWR